MDFSKTLNVSKRLLFILLVVLPLGQLARSEIGFFGFSLPFLAVDAISAIFLLVLTTYRFETTQITRHFQFVIALGIFSWVVNLYFFGILSSLIGVLYLIRLLSYFAICLVSHNLFKKHPELRTTVFHGLISVAWVVSVLGWFQYFLYPDLRGLLEWGWDEHMYRLVSTFLDPTFTSIFLVFAFLSTLHEFLNKRRIVFLGLSAFFFVTVMFTYSRAGYLALLVGSIILFFRNIKGTFIVLIAFAAMLFLLPRVYGEGVRLERTASILAKIENYKETASLILKSPVVGLGYNNLCVAKGYYGISGNNDSHACSGSDSSLLFILSTMGVIGGFVFLNLGYEMYKLTSTYYKRLFLALLGALILHSLFSNSMFYPFVAIWFLLFLALAMNE